MRVSFTCLTRKLTEQSSSLSHRLCGPSQRTRAGGCITAGLLDNVGQSACFADLPEPSKEVLDRELSSIKELHEAEPDSKCTCQP